MDESAEALDYYPVDLASSLVGDRWSLLIVRELSIGSVGYNEILRALPGLSRSTLSARLRHLVHIGVLNREAVEHPQYALTESGRALVPVVEALGEWALRFPVPASRKGSEQSALTASRMHRALDLRAVPRRRVCIGIEFIRPEPAMAWVQAGVTRHGSWGLGHATHEVDLFVHATDEVFDDLWHGRRSCEDALAAHDVVLDGPGDLVKSYASWFPARSALALEESRAV